MRPLILLTNDDGVFSPGLAAVATAVKDLGDLLIAAPRYQQTSMSRAIWRGEKAGIIDTVTLDLDGEPYTAYGIHGSPAQSVLHGVFELAPRLPDLCISGINYGENIGMTTGISGTIGAAWEAHTCGIPALATSTEADLSLHRSDEYGVLDWTAAAHFTRQFAQKILKDGLPAGTAILNLNTPATATPATPVRATVQSQQSYFYFVAGQARDFTQPHRLKVESVVKQQSLEPDSDIQAFLYDRVVSVTPLRGNMTADSDMAKWL